MNDTRKPPSPRIAPLPIDHNPELKEHFAQAPKNLGFVPNSWLIMQSKPKFLRAFSQLTRRTVGPSRQQGRPRPQAARRPCRLQGRRLPVLHGAYHRGGGAPGRRRAEARCDLGLSDKPAVQLRPSAWRSISRFAAAQQPNQVTDDDFAAMREHYSRGADPGDRADRVRCSASSTASTTRWGHRSRTCRSQTGAEVPRQPRLDARQAREIAFPQPDRMPSRRRRRAGPHERQDSPLDKR